MKLLKFKDEKQTFVKFKDRNSILPKKKKKKKRKRKERAETH